MNNSTQYMKMQESSFNNMNYENGMRFPKEWDKKEIEAFYDLLYWNMKYSFYEKDETEYNRIRKLYIDMFNLETVKKMEKFFFMTKEYNTLLNDKGIPSTYGC